MRILTLISCALMIGLLMPQAHSAPPVRGSKGHPDKQSIVRAWRLISIEYSGPHGALVETRNWR